MRRSVVCIDALLCGKFVAAKLPCGTRAAAAPAGWLGQMTACVSSEDRAPRRSARRELSSPGIAAGRRVPRRNTKPAGRVRPLQPRQAPARGHRVRPPELRPLPLRSEEHNAELQSLMRITYAVFCLKKKKNSIL